MANFNTIKSLFDLEPTAKLDFFEIFFDPDDLSASYRFFGGQNGFLQPITWQGVAYNPIAIETSGFEKKGDKSLPRPKLSIGNKDFFISKLCRAYDNLTNRKVIRKQVFAKHLDDVNFEGGINPFGVADSNAGFSDEIYFISRKTGEDREVVTFELVSSLELENINIPRRQIQARFCAFSYRGKGCRYIGKPIADSEGKTFEGSSGYNLTLVDQGAWSSSFGTYNAGDYVYKNSSIFIQELINGEIVRIPVKDIFVCVVSHSSEESSNPSLDTIKWKRDFCPKTIAGCKARFGTQDSLPFGGQPGTYSFGA